MINLLVLIFLSCSVFAEQNSPKPKLFSKLDLESESQDPQPEEESEEDWAQPEIGDSSVLTPATPRIQAIIPNYEEFLEQNEEQLELAEKSQEEKSTKMADEEKTPSEKTSKIASEPNKEKKDAAKPSKSSKALAKDKKDEKKKEPILASNEKKIEPPKADPTNDFFAHLMSGIGGVFALAALVVAITSTQ